MIFVARPRNALAHTFPCLDAVQRCNDSVPPSDELVFEVTQESDGGLCAERLTENIFTQGNTWDELRSNVREAVEAFFFDRPAPQHMRLHRN